LNLLPETLKRSPIPAQCSATCSLLPMPATGARVGAELPRRGDAPVVPTGGVAGSGQHYGQPLGSLEAVGGASRGTVSRVCSVVGAVAPGRSLGTASHTMRPHAQAAPLHRACGWCGWCRCGRCRGCRWRGHSAPPLARWIRTGTPGVGSPGRAGGWRAGGVAHQLTPCRVGHACWPAARGTTAPGSVPTGSPAKQQAGWASIGLCPAFGTQTGLFAASATGARVGAELPHRGDTPGVPTGGVAGPVAGHRLALYCIRFCPATTQEQTP
jgi:hypothetical protein